MSEEATMANEKVSGACSCKMTGRGFVSRDPDCFVHGAAPVRRRGESFGPMPFDSVAIGGVEVPATKWAGGPVAKVANLNVIPAAAWDCAACKWTGPYEDLTPPRFDGDDLPACPKCGETEHLGTDGAKPAPLRWLHVRGGEVVNEPVYRNGMMVGTTRGRVTDREGEVRFTAEQRELYGVGPGSMIRETIVLDIDGEPPGATYRIVGAYTGDHGVMILRLVALHAAPATRGRFADENPAVTPEQVRAVVDSLKAWKEQWRPSTGYATREDLARAGMPPPWRTSDNYGRDISSWVKPAYPPIPSGPVCYVTDGKRLCSREDGMANDDAAKVTCPACRRILDRRAIDALLREDARRFPAFARARFAAVMAMVEWRDMRVRDGLGSKSDPVDRSRSILHLTHEHEMRGRSPENLALIARGDGTAWETVYERERGRCRS